VIVTAIYAPRPALVPAIPVLLATTLPRTKPAPPVVKPTPAVPPAHPPVHRLTVPHVPTGTIYRPAPTNVSLAQSIAQLVHQPLPVQTAKITLIISTQVLQVVPNATRTILPGPPAQNQAVPSWLSAAFLDITTT
jgi:hypothetical protein